MDIKEISIRHFFNILSWLDINETTICCIKTIRYILLILGVLSCLIKQGIYPNDFVWLGVQ
jgi:hypothetical protein